jgi:hypothetical protein
MCATPTAPMLAEFSGYSFHFVLGVRKHCAIIRRFNDLVWRPRLRQTLLELVEVVGAHRTALTTQNYEADRSVEPWYFRFRKTARNLFGQPKARYSATLAIALFYIVVDLYLAVPDHHVARQALQSFADLPRNEPFLIHRETCGLEVVH